MSVSLCNSKLKKLDPPGHLVSAKLRPFDCLSWVDIQQWREKIVLLCVLKERWWHVPAIDPLDLTHSHSPFIFYSILMQWKANTVEINLTLLLYGSLCLSYQLLYLGTVYTTPPIKWQSRALYVKNIDMFKGDLRTINKGRNYGWCLAYIGNNSNLDSNHHGGHCMYKCSNFNLA